MRLPGDWQDQLAEETQQPYWHALQQFVADERRRGIVYPSAGHELRALEMTPWADTRVVILGQDPYHGPGQAHGLSFSVPAGVRFPPSLRNIFAELASDLGCDPPVAGDLTGWAQQGVLLLNTVLTVRQGEANSHRGKGWEQFTDAVIRAVNRREPRVVFVLWGNPARKKRAMIDTARHAVVESPHPSPLSAHRGFFGSRPFSQVNQTLAASQASRIDWTLART